LDLREEDYQSGEVHFRDSLLRQDEVGDEHGIVEAIEGLATLAAVRAQPRRAMLLAGSAAKWREKGGAQPPPAELSRLEGRMAGAGQARGAEAAAAARAEGQAMTLEQVVVYALEEKSG